MENSTDTSKRPILHLFGENVKEARKRAGLTLQELAERFGSTKQDLSAIELGRRNVSLELVEKIARGIGVDPEILFRKK